MKNFKKVTASIVAALMLMGIASCTKEDTKKKDRKDKDNDDEIVEVEDDDDDKETEAELEVETEPESTTDNKLKEQFVEQLKAIVLERKDEFKSEYYAPYFCSDIPGDMYIYYSEGDDEIDFVYWSEASQARLEYRWTYGDDTVYLYHDLVYQDDCRFYMYGIGGIPTNEVEETLIDICENPDSYGCMVLDGDVINEHDVKADTMIIYARLVQYMDYIFEENGLNPIDFEFGSEYKNYEPSEPLGCEFIAEIEEHEFTDGICDICGKAWTNCLGEAIIALDSDYDGGNWSAETFQMNETILTSSDYVRMDYYVDAECTEFMYVRMLDPDLPNVDLHIRTYADSENIVVLFNYSTVEGDIKNIDDDLQFFCSARDFFDIVDMFAEGLTPEEIYNRVDGNFGYSYFSNGEMMDNINPYTLKELAEYAPLCINSFESYLNEIGMSFEDFGLVY
ncbi:MAG: hypothetical protein MJ172_07160 [Clostridia bacterium]|nr:hypothetical protein [Clostridia bacterium]